MVRQERWVPRLSSDTLRIRKANQTTIMTATKCYRFRLEPNKEQEAQFLRFAGCRRFVWNYGLSRKQEVYKTTGKGIGYNALAAELVALKKCPETAFLKECHSQVLIDVGLKSFLTLDSGEKIEPPKFYRRAERKLKRLQRQLSRCKKTSRNRSLAKIRVAKHHRRTANQRNDFLHKTSAKLVAKYDTLCIEDLNLKGLVKTKLAKSFSDAALGAFFQMLNYKTAYRFGQVVKVGRFYPSSKTCHDCKSIQHLELSDRDWMCIGCGVIHDRDHNAAKNILSEGLRILAVGMVESLNADGGDVRLATASGSR